MGNNITENAIRTALASVKYPGFSRDIVSFGLVKGIEIEGNEAVIRITLSTRDPKIPQQIHREAEEALQSVAGLKEAKLDISIQDPPAQQGAPQGKSGIPGVKHIIAVGSGKGGVGKSTVSANLAVSLAQQGHRVGLCDCDLYGPSMSMMLGNDDRPMATEDNEILPLTAHGIQFMSMGSLLDDESPVIVRGPMATRYIQQFLRQVLWEDLDYLILDLPPGTGDIQLTVVQTVALTGAVIVTTPQEVALTDARKAASMFAKVNVPILGIIENMSYFLCPSDNKRYYIFGQGGGASEAARLNARLLGEVPIDIATREQGDKGSPVALNGAENPAGKIFLDIAEKLHEQVAS